MSDILESLSHIVSSVRDLDDLPADKLGDVVIVPGILESTLVENGGHQLWPSSDVTLEPLRLGRGAGDNISAANLLFTCAPLQETLEEHWRVHTFPYDWRHSCRQAATALRTFIRAHIPNGDVHVVTHSMGGLIARLAIQLDPRLLGNGKLVMLGTPNHGSVLALAALTSQLGAAAFFQLLSSFVPRVDAMSVARTWPSVYELLPCPIHDPSFRDVFERPTADVDRTLVQDALDFHTTLDRLQTPPGTIYIAGSNFPTPDGGALPADGDGVVSHNRGLLRGATTFIVPGDHVSLPANILVRRSLSVLLHSGRPGALAPFARRPPTT